MSLIPYAEPGRLWQVVLRDPLRKALVVYNLESSQLVLRTFDGLSQEGSQLPTFNRRGSLPQLIETTDGKLWSESPSPREDVNNSLIRPELDGLNVNQNLGQEICSYCKGTGLVPSRKKPSSGNVKRNTSFSNEIPSIDYESSIFVDDNSQPYISSDYFKMLQYARDDDYEDSNHMQQRKRRNSISHEAFSEGYYERFFIEKRELGRGGRGSVSLVEHVLDGVSLGEFACKKVPIGDDHTWLERALKEVKLLRVAHPNLVRYNHIWLESSPASTFRPSVPCAYILQEYCNGGSLEDYINKRLGASKAKDNSDLKSMFRRRRKMGKDQLSAGNDVNPDAYLSSDEILSFFRDIIAGVRHLHESGIVHRDLKPSNCLLNFEANREYPRVLVADFGECQLIGTKRTSTGTTGTAEYCAPEVMKFDDELHAYQDFSTKSDMFSLGMTLYFICFMKLPYENIEDFDGLRHQVESFSGFEYNRDLRPDLPEEVFELLSLLLDPDPNLRPSAEEVQQLLGSNGTPVESRTRSSGSFHIPNDMRGRITIINESAPVLSQAIQDQEDLVSDDDNDPARFGTPLQVTDSSYWENIEKTQTPNSSTDIKQAKLRSDWPLIMINIFTLLLMVIDSVKFSNLCSPYAVKPVALLIYFAIVSLLMSVKLTIIGKSKSRIVHTTILGVFILFTILSTWMPASSISFYSHLQVCQR